MKKTIIGLGLAWVCGISWSQSSCFLAYENQTELAHQGRGCYQRFSPESTFKIALSLMGYDSGLLKDETHPSWPFKENYELYLNVWKGPHNPKTWIRDSCVWYSQVLTQRLGMQGFKDYVAKFKYGNQDVSGDKGQNNGLTHAWLSSSLAISPKEQILFLQKIIDNQLPLTPKSFEMTKNILYIQELAGGWKLYGKTGNGLQLTSDQSSKTDRQHGWFVGWIEKKGRVIPFVEHIQEDKKKTGFASFRAKSQALAQLFDLINDLEK